MKSRWSAFLFILAISITAPTVLSSCQRKSGCPAYESVHTKTNRKGELSTKRGRSSLFPKQVGRGR